MGGCERVRVGETRGQVGYEFTQGQREVQELSVAKID